MIQANELRIGNWVQGSSNDVYQMPFRVSIRDFSFPDFFNNVRPIPITAEILEKSRFEKTETLWNRDQMFGFICTDRDGYNVQDYEGGNVLDVPFYFIHQLQNLYFAFTGQELTIEL